MYINRFKTNRGFTLTKLCPTCNLEFKTRESKDSKFCSKKCMMDYRNPDIWTKLPCDWCKQDYYKRTCRLIAKTGLHFCCRKCKDLAQRLTGLDNLNYIYQTEGVSRETRLTPSELIIRHNLAMVCKCGENRRYCLDIHHIDGDFQNNNLDNLEVVCCNCHAVRHLDFVNGVWIRNFKKLTPLDKIELL